MKPTRRDFLQQAGRGLSLSVLPSLIAGHAVAGDGERADTKGLLVTGVQLHVVRVNQRGDWYFIELSTNKGLTGLGECSHAFNKAQTEGEQTVRKELAAFFELLKDQPAFNIERFRQLGFAKADTKLRRTVVSGLEQALWDLNAKVLGVPVYQLLGGKLRDRLKVYANINRATNERDSNGRRPVAGFQRNAELALQQGFKAVKLAPFDEMKALDKSTPQQVQADIQHAIDCIAGVRSTIGKETDLLIDVHSHLDPELSTQTAQRLEPYGLFWFEEPVDPQQYPAETKAIRSAIKQVLAGGESIFGRAGYRQLIDTQALGIVMPDVKHCGGLQELKYIAAAAEAAGNVQVAPHNPSGPVATAASVAVCASIPNFSILEYAFGEVPWSRELVSPAEAFEDGHLLVPDAPGFGITLNRELLRQHL